MNMTIDELLATLATVPAPENMSTLCYSDVNCNVYSGDVSVLKKVVASLDPFIQGIDKSVSSPAFSIQLLQSVAPDLLCNALKAATEEFDVDTSLYADLCSKGRRVGAENVYAIWIVTTDSVCIFDRINATVIVFNSHATQLELDGKRILKSLIALSMENAGRLVVHASGLHSDSGCTLLAGDSRNGKTTLLLEGLTNFNTDMLSCDTCVLDMSTTEPWARGWPSNFSLSLGTLFDYASLQDFVPSDDRGKTYTQAWDIYPKRVLDTPQVVQAMECQIIPQACLASIIFVRFAPAGPVGMRPLSDANEIRAWLTAVCLGSRDPLYPNWHGLLKINDDKIETNLTLAARALSIGRTPVWEMCWAPGPETLLRRVASLESVSRKKICGRRRR
jgi:hypothetical protein